MTNYPPLNTKDLPSPPRWWRAVGVGIIVTGMAMGTGELVMWPNLVTQYGLAILWFALVGITLQYFINQEIARATLATGESFFTSSGRLIRWSPLFWLFSVVLIYVWPGWASTLGTILAVLIGFGHYLWWAWASLALVLIIVFAGREAYKVLEKSLKIIVPIFIIILLYISFLNLTWFNIFEALRGLFSFGYWPEEIDINILLGAIVFAGAGGMLNLCVSLWYRDKGTGMAIYSGKIKNPINGKTEAIGAIGNTFPLTESNLKNWQHWLKYLRFDQGFVFWFIGLTTIVLMSLNAYVVLEPLNLSPSGTDLAVILSEIFESQLGFWGGKLYLLMAYLMLFSVMWTIIDAMSRIISDIVYTNTQTGSLIKIFAWTKNLSLHHLYYSLILVITLIQAVLLPFSQPLVFLLLSSVLGGFTMALYTPILLYYNNRHLAKPLRPGIISNLFLFGAFVFYSAFAIISIWEMVGKIF
ncbi:MAG: Nramp family divalent metal transporter [Candidatus Paceibacterota bacterium]|jgi:hypothetical protein